MNNFKFSTFEFPIIDFIKDKDLFIMDLFIPITALRNEFLPFYEEHITDNNSFSYSINTQEYFGRFGQLLYDNDGNVRLCVTHKPLESIGNSYLITPSEVTYYNLVHTTVNQEKKINSLITLLENKNVISAEEAENIKHYLTPIDKGIDIQREVKNLKEYLNYSSDTLEDIRINP